MREDILLGPACQIEPGAERQEGEAGLRHLRATAAAHGGSFHSSDTVLNRVWAAAVYTFGLDVPEGNTQAYTRQFAQRMVKKMRDSI